MVYGLCFASHLDIHVHGTTEPNQELDAVHIIWQKDLDKPARVICINHLLRHHK